MKGLEIIKKELLRRKIVEIFGRNPKRKTALIQSRVGNQRTAWKVDRRGKGFHITEVTASRSEYLLAEAMGTVSATGPQDTRVGGQKPQVGQKAPGQTSRQFNVDQFASLDLNDQMEMIRSGMVPLNQDSIAGMFASVVKPGGGKDIVAIRDFINDNIKMAEPIAQKPVGSAVGFLTNLTNQKRLMKAHNNPALREQEGEEEEPKTKPEPEKTTDASLEVGPEPDDEQSEVEPTKSSEEQQLDRQVMNKPVKDISVHTDEEGDHVVLDLVSLPHPIDIVFADTGETKYKFGDLVRVLKKTKADTDKK